MTSARTGNAAHASHSAFAHPERNVKEFGIQHSMKIADFGAGSGAYVRAMAVHLEGSGKVYAIDVQKDLLRRIHTDALKIGLKNIEILWADLEAKGGSKLADNALDIVLISNLLFQIEDKIAVLEEAKRIIKPNGRIIVIDWSESFGGMGPHPDDVVGKEDMLALAREAGLSFQKEFKAGAHHYALVFRKIVSTRVTIKAV